MKNIKRIKSIAFLYKYDLSSFSFQLFTEYIYNKHKNKQIFWEAVHAFLK